MISRRIASARSLMTEGNGRLLNLLMVIQMTDSFRMGIISPILALMVRRHGISIIEIGLLGLVGTLGWFIFEPLSGLISDRVNKRTMIAFALISTSTIYLLYPFATTYNHYLFLAFALSSFSSASSIPSKSLLAELLPTRSRGHAYGRYMAIVSGSSVIAPFIGGFVSESLGYSLPFYTAAAVGFLSLSAIVLMGRLPETKPMLHKPQTKISELLSGDLLSIYIVRGLYFFNFPFRSSFLPIILNESPILRATETQIGSYMTVVGFMTAVSQAFLGDMIDRAGSKKVIVASCGLLSVTYIGLLALSDITQLLLIGALQGALQAGTNAGMMVHLMEIDHRGKTGVAMGLYSESENIGAIVASPVFGFAYSSYGPISSLVLITGALLVTTGMSSILLRKKPSST